MVAPALQMHSVEGQVVWNCCGHTFIEDDTEKNTVSGYSTTRVCRLCLAGANYHQRQCSGVLPALALAPATPAPDSATGQDGPPAGPSYGPLAEERSSVYGDPEQSHRAIGLAWEAVLRNRYQGMFEGTFPGGTPWSMIPGALFPPELVALMLAAFKLVRAARPTFHLDSYEDMVVYFKEFSQQWRQRDQG